ncbi:hypothetical protein C8R45DRAFT_1054516 [Mycena sanguinolenta]|nr:hypothetical protein C8R45DRAFT_1054516 [Mycena sanguinolenta]
MCHEYRHLLMLLRAGRAHEDGGVLATAAGRLAINLPDDWDKEGNEKRSLMRRLVSSYLKDSPLLPGSAYLMSTCSRLAALDQANTKFACRYSATGVGMGVCARHEFVQPNGKIIMYDIVCQWWVNLRKRLKTLSSMVRIVLVMKLLRFVIPKMHIHSHTLGCQQGLLLNLVPSSAQMDGEGIERLWAHIGGKGPGSCEDTLN